MRRSAGRQGNKGSLIWLCEVRNEVVAASHYLPALVVFVLFFPLLLLIATSWGLFEVPCWFVRFCLFCCDPKLVGVAPVAVLQLSLFWLMRAVRSVLLPCLGVCHDWCCIVSFKHFLHRWRFLDTCVSCRICIAVCAIVTAAIVATHPRSSVWLRRLR